MIIVKIKSGLGNQLFGYAFGRYLSLKLRVELKLDTNWFKNSDYRAYWLNHFDINATKATRMDLSKVNFPVTNLQTRIKRILFPKPYIRCFKQDSFRNNYRVKDLPDNQYLDCLFLSENYFLELRDQIRNDLKIITESNNLRVRQIEDEIMRTESVFIHLRRGDFKNGSWAGHYVLPNSYYQNALTFMNKKLTNPRYYIFSDEIEVVKKEFPIPSATYIDFTDNELDDFRLMRACKHAIIANSTFSWWAAYLQNNEDKIVIAPSKFLETDVVDYSDLYPETWIKI